MVEIFLPRRSPTRSVRKSGYARNSTYVILFERRNLTLPRPLRILLRKDAETREVTFYLESVQPLSETFSVALVRRSSCLWNLRTWWRSSSQRGAIDDRSPNRWLRSNWSQWKTVFRSKESRHGSLCPASWLRRVCCRMPASKVQAWSCSKKALSLKSVKRAIARYDDTISW